MDIFCFSSDMIRLWMPCLDFLGMPCLDFLGMQCPMVVYVRDTSQHYPGEVLRRLTDGKEHSLSHYDTGNTNNNLNKLKTEVYIDL